MVKLTFGEFLGNVFIIADDAGIDWGGLAMVIDVGGCVCPHRLTAHLPSSSRSQDIFHRSIFNTLTVLQPRSLSKITDSDCLCGEVGTNAG